MFTHGVNRVSTQEAGDKVFSATCRWVWTLSGVDHRDPAGEVAHRASLW
jgi:hypothetical protein